MDVSSSNSASAGSEVFSGMTDEFAFLNKNVFTDGQLLYPNRVSVNRVTGDFVVTERSPTHQIQI